MPLFPHSTLLVDSPLSVEQAAARLRQATGPRTLFYLGFGPRPHPFVGEVSGHEVRIERAIAYQNSFLPRIRAQLEARAEGCRLAGTMSLHPLVAVFLVVWFGAILLGMLTMTLILLAGGELRTEHLIPPGMLIFGWILCSGAFTVEAYIARGRLAALLDESGHAR